MSATDPDLNVSVFASAGSGKTYLLVTRILRLLLAGARPDGILAVTFTRMAAGEMQTRLTERLLEWQDLDDAALEKALADMGVPPDDTLLERARRLFETTLLADRPVRTTTFHAFCQDILARFPLEAQVPPGFELADNERELRDRAWDALVSVATREPDGPLAGALQALLTTLGGVDNVRKALDGFLAHREDWWAWTEHEADPLAFARARIAAELAVDPDADPRADCLDPPTREALAELAALLARNTPTDQGLGQGLADALAREDADLLFHAARTALLTQANTLRSRKASAAQAKRLGGAETEDRFLALHRSLGEEFLDALDRLARQHSLRLNRAWFTAGLAYLDHYQAIKEELRILDFTDLEWRTYRLLNHGDHALWVQYRLDSRIDHLLIDEFQDTNPTQWRLMLPLLEELAAQGDRQGRSVFLVGDTKQSIYSFRRADPRLQEIAARWIRERLGGRPESLDRSWRSSPAVMDFVNRVFTAAPALREALPDFHPHDTHLQNLWGRVEVWPLVEAETDTGDATPPEGLRNPLTTARADTGDDLHAWEGLGIARRIREMVAAGLMVGRGAQARPIGYGDITILVRNRTHVGAIEDALRDAGVPYLSAARGELLDHLEVRDLEALLRILITPHDDLALAQVLRSPVFSVGHGELEQLADAGSGPWHARLEALAPALPDESPLRQAAEKLGRWRLWSDALPVHDLLDRIFLDGNVLARYAAGSRPDRVPTVLASLIRFLELALEVDSGRYPSLVHFLSRLHGLRDQADAAPDTPPVRGASARVRIMTIHAAKGLEAPVIFLADAAAVPRDSKTYEALVDWPTGEDHPRLMRLLPRSGDLDRITADALDRYRAARAREDANLLYVALTRARQVLIVSASARARSNGGWYAHIREAVSPEAATTDGLPGRYTDGGIWVHETGQPPPSGSGAVTDTPGSLPPPAGLASPLARAAPELEIAPSREAGGFGDRGPDSDRTGDEDARLRGVAIHRLLEWLTSGQKEPDAALCRRLAAEQALDPDHPELADWLAEARAVVADPALAAVFAPQPGTRDYNEVPLQYTHADGRTVYGIIDRLRVTEERVLLVDYKTHRVADYAAARRLAERYAAPMALYAEGVRRLWPGRTVQGLLLFTHIRKVVKG
ncbi:UvrD-helicase domain-containing protein [Thioalkalivibrio thiocyanodenitrificans]|uniref:UvrD-helicase domain-containing protein n=1 Tax=Thioalkalivibrio thiocyanodenitrificans TaxID=243063 RepID=UPI00037FF31F|nr:UvrD-helicase domain-containing protein [Thioalkalivibrio thiocyanodenitrificans]